MKFNKWIALLILSLFSVTTISQTLRPTKTDTIEANVPAGTVDVLSPLTINSTTAMDAILDEDTLVSNSATALATQQSIKAYVDASATSSISSLNNIGDVTITSPGVNDVLAWSGTAWIDSASAAAGGIAEWVTATIYAIDDVVHESNKIYKALTNHTSGVFATDLGNNDWIELSTNSTADSIQLTVATSTPAHSEGLMWYDSVNEALVVYNSEADVTHQIGQEFYVKVRNISGSTITNGQVIYITSNDSGFPTVELGDATSAATSQTTIGIATHDIENNTNGFVTRSGVVRELNTTAFTSGDRIWLDPATPGGITNTMPTSPNFLITIGTVGEVHASTGTINVAIDVAGNNIDVIKVFNGASLEDSTIAVTSDGAAVTLSLEKNGGGDLSLFFNGTFTVFDSSPSATTTLTAGSDTSPTENFVYILESSGLLTSSTSSFPATQHVPVATVVVQSAASVQTDDAYKVHAWTDHLSNGGDMGHLSHLNKWIRNQHATWRNGMAATPTITVNGGSEDNIDIAVSAGLALQLHEHSTPLYDSASSTDVYVTNFHDGGSPIPFNKVTDLNQIQFSSDGATDFKSNNSRFSFVLWQSVNEITNESKIFLNVPSCDYSSDIRVIDDINKCSNYNIPNEYKGTGVLIARLSFQFQTVSSGTWTLIQNEDLRGQIPSIFAGGSAGFSSEFPDNTFKLFDDGDSTKVMTFEASNITTATTRTMTVPDLSGNLVLGDALTYSANSIPFFNGSGLLDEDLLFTFNAATDVLSVPIIISGTTTIANQNELRFEDSAGGDYLAFKAPSVLTATSTTFTLPDGDGTVNQLLSTDGSGTLAWASPGSTLLNITTSSTSTTVLVSDDVLIGDSTSGAFTFTLPTAVGITGKIYEFKRINGTAVNLINIDGNAAETIDGVASINLATINEIVKIASDGTNWIILSRETDTAWRSYTPTGAWTTNTTYTGFWKRNRDEIDLQVRVATSGAPTATNLLINLPFSLAANTGKLTGSAANTMIFGTVYATEAGVLRSIGQVEYNSTGDVRVRYYNDVGTTLEWGSSVSNTAPFTFGAGDFIDVHFSIPVNGWESL